MVLIFGGTTEGRIAARVCDMAAKPLYYSTKAGEQHIAASNITMVWGDKSCNDIISFCKEHSIKLIIDAAHPFATAIHHNIIEAAKVLSIATIRFDRQTEKIDSTGVVFFDSLEDIIKKIEEKKYQKILALTGVKSSGALLPLTKECDIRLRIMDRADSWQHIKQVGFPKDKVIIYEQESDRELFESFAPNVIITKESGKSGNFHNKIALAQSLGIEVFVISRPMGEVYDSLVYGEYGLRGAIDKFVPEFFALKIGYTTGSTATAASVAAATALLSGKAPSEVEITLAGGEPIKMPIAKTSTLGSVATATAIKNGGDDPDITHGLEIDSKLELLGASKEIVICGGKGVGRVGRAGLGIEVGDSAINPVPRKMIRDNLSRVFKEYGYSGGAKVTISVPKGEEIAKKTFNARLGIEGGISILGTSGIVEPFSNKAFLESIARQIDIVVAMGQKWVVINSGAKSERYIKERYGDAPQEIFIHYGNLIGDTLALCSQKGITRVTLGVMMGKAVKLAAGELDTHSKHSTMNKEFIAELCHKAGCSPCVTKRVKDMVVARELWDITNSSSFYELLRQHCYKTCSNIYKSELEIVLIKDSGELV